jgi:hypothetical protein
MDAIAGTNWDLDVWSVCGPLTVEQLRRVSARGFGVVAVLGVLMVTLNLRLIRDYD